jgi:ribosome biogenesis GTPase / thiamine phosphate phosphatase
LRRGALPASQTGPAVAGESVEGRIIKGVGGFYEVWVPEQETCVTCKARGVFRREGSVPVAGDRVLVETSRKEPGQGFLLSILPRHSEFVRPPVANMDCMAIVVSAVSPQPDYPLVDKLILACELRGIRPLLVVNKMELEDAQDTWERLRCMYEPGGYVLLPVSCKSGLGMPQLMAALSGCTTVLAGQSGVGKSTLLNALLTSDRMKTGALSEKIGRGRHTTRHAELIPLPDQGWLCDTAGFSRYELDPIAHETLDTLYPEFEPERTQCRFPGCSHLQEPDCAVRDKLAAGGLSEERYARYGLFYEELRDRHQNRYRRQGGA